MFLRTFTWTIALVIGFAVVFSASPRSDDNKVVLADGMQADVDARLDTYKADVVNDVASMETTIDKVAAPSTVEIIFLL